MPTSKTVVGQVMRIAWRTVGSIVARVSRDAETIETPSRASLQADLLAAQQRAPRLHTRVNREDEAPHRVQPAPQSLHHTGFTHQPLGCTNAEITPASSGRPPENRPHSTGPDQERWDFRR